MMKLFWHWLNYRWFMHKMRNSPEAKNDLMAHWDYYSRAKYHWESFLQIGGEL